MKYRNILFNLFFGVLLFGCVSQNYSVKNDSDDLMFYTLSKGETLSAFIENQNKMNDYAKYENIPTDKDIRDAFASYEELILEFRSKLSEDDIKEFSEEFSGISIEEFMKLNFLYSICYNRKNKVWYIDLIGRSTTLYLEYSSNRDYAYKNEFRYSNNLIPFINRWMDLNTISSLESGFRVNINDDLDDVIVELFGIQIN
jgi:hypothetical protein